MTASPNATKELLDKIRASVTRWNPSDPTYDEALDALRAYGDQREREVLERAARAIADWVTFGQIPYGPVGAKAVILALIPKGPAND